MHAAGAGFILCSYTSVILKPAEEGAEDIESNQMRAGTQTHTHTHSHTHTHQANRTTATIVTRAGSTETDFKDAEREAFLAAVSAARGREEREEQEERDERARQKERREEREREREREEVRSRERAETCNGEERLRDRECVEGGWIGGEGVDVEYSEWCDGDVSMEVRRCVCLGGGLEEGGGKGRVVCVACVHGGIGEGVCLCGGWVAR